MRRDPCTGFYYPFYKVYAAVWNREREEYEDHLLLQAQAYEDAITLVKNTNVDADVFQIDVYEETYESTEKVALKVAITSAPGYEFYDPRTEKDIE